MKLSKIQQDECYLTESYHVDYNNPIYSDCIDICVQSAALYNKTLYIIGILYYNSISLPSYFELVEIMRKVCPDYYNAFISVDIVYY